MAEPDDDDLLMRRAEKLASQLVRMKAAGSPPPTPGPTREQVAAVVHDELLGKRPTPITYEARREAAIDAVMALWSTRPATVLHQGDTTTLADDDPDQSWLDCPGGSLVLDVPPGTHVVVAVTEDPTP